MTPFTRLEDFLACPNERYLTGPVSLSFIVDPRLVGVIVWGRPTAEQITDLLRVHERMRPVLGRQVAAVVDVQQLEWPDPSAFGAVVTYLSGRQDWIAEYIDRLALVRATSGPVGAAAAGFFDVSPHPFTVGAFSGLREAFAWTGSADAGGLAQSLTDLVAGASGTPTLLRRLREQLDVSPGRLSLQDAAQTLGVTERTLQRLLRSWGTGFRLEQNGAQVRVAQRLLRGTQCSLGEIAVAVGCGSLPQFSTMFRRMTGVTPSAWRAAHLPTSPEL